MSAKVLAVGEGGVDGGVEGGGGGGVVGVVGGAFDVVLVGLEDSTFGLIPVTPAHPRVISKSRSVTTNPNTLIAERTLNAKEGIQNLPKNMPRRVPQVRDYESTTFPLRLAGSASANSSTRTCERNDDRIVLYMKQLSAKIGECSI